MENKIEDYMNKYNAIYGNYRFGNIKELKDLKEAQKELKDLLKEYKEVCKVKDDYLITFIGNLINDIQNDINNSEQS